ncbi:MAG: hypothetical protein SFH39_13565 [Candidatus Magnetobacterium sp. LHC-1]|uniref:Uncharacterized protein n=1 Tax=Candidatus Magnetobacterium casense TaxID=1455061 RepID=A0ABS6S0Z3_9BACT|nr:hypothetical protein [Candidatus Magnetobacterium casensis]MBF0606782.1 hypothetical protein [Nitrospirota bacterium]MBV6342525.1 hypothetical protein [Candidatus Magnetobacterium casensis]
MSYGDKLELDIDKYCLRYGLDDNYHTLCSNCLTNNSISIESHHNQCTHCGQTLDIRRYPISVIAIRGNNVTSAVIRDQDGLRVVCGNCGLIIYVKCEGEDFTQCIDCGMQIDYSSYPD